VTLVVDASVVVAALIYDGEAGTWAESLLGASDLAAPHLLPVEVSQTLRRSVAAGKISDDLATLAVHDLTDLAITLYPFAPQVGRIWGLRASVTAYDAWYVALAEELDAPLATLDRRLVGAPGPECEFVHPW
jgi:predicted nucleic acid-binding protein